MAQLHVHALHVGNSRCGAGMAAPDYELRAYGINSNQICFNRE
jgi:hypothetical protein